jgi:hypothetical protein
MKTQYLKTPILLFLLMSRLFVLGQYENRTPIVDTSKLDYETIERAYNAKSLSLNEVNAMYYFDFDTTDIGSWAGGPQMYSGELGRVHFLENWKKYRYHITDNEIFNGFLPGCDFYYEMTAITDERVIAQYNGKYFRYEDFNYLMREMGKGDLPEVVKTKILAQWRLWMFDPNIHIMSMDTVEYMVPGENILLMEKGRTKFVRVVIITQGMKVKLKLMGMLMIL